MGKPLLNQVGKQWTKWCNGNGYVATDFEKDIKAHNYDELEFPSMWLHATDDGIANFENIKDMTRVYTKSQAEIISLDPKELGKNKLGHMGFFSSKNKELWRSILDWLNTTNENQQATL